MHCAIHSTTNEFFGLENTEPIQPLQRRIPWNFNVVKWPRKPVQNRSCVLRENTAITNLKPQHARVHQFRPIYCQFRVNKKYQAFFGEKHASASNRSPFATSRRRHKRNCYYRLARVEPKATWASIDEQRFEKFRFLTPLIIRPAFLSPGWAWCSLLTKYARKWHWARRRRGLDLHIRMVNFWKVCLNKGWLPFYRILSEKCYYPVGLKGQK